MLSDVFYYLFYIPMRILNTEIDFGDFRFTPLKVLLVLFVIEIAIFVIKFFSGLDEGGKESGD